MPVDAARQQSSAARERILDAAAKVMREQGLGAATTKEIARAAGYSEAMLYKHFSDKQQIFMGVLQERIGALQGPGALVGQGDVRENLVQLVIQLMTFYVNSFPMSASIFSTPELLRSWREGMAVHGGGPRVPIHMVERYLAAEIGHGRLEGIDPTAVADLLVGAAFQAAFFACFEGLDTVPDAVGLARRLVAAAV
jgi:AcrR family transcriptional regulator